MLIFHLFLSVAYKSNFKLMFAVKVCNQAGVIAIVYCVKNIKVKELTCFIQKTSVE
jgi:hypothetical protein